MSITILIVTFCGNCDSSDRADAKSERSIRLDIESSYPNCIQSDMNSDTNDNDKHQAKGMCCFFFFRIKFKSTTYIRSESTSDDDKYTR